MQYSIYFSLKTQLRVVFALMMREVHTLYGKTKLGYLWAIIQTAFGIGVMWLLRLICRMPPPHGLSVLAYLVVGYVFWDIISNSVLKCITAIEANRTLLTYPQVTPIDVMISRCIIITCTELLSGFVLILFGYLFGYTIQIANLGGLIFTIFVSCCFGLGVGMIFSALNSYFPVIERIIPICFRFLFFGSGIFFSITSISGRIGEWVLWNPILQLIEYTRTCVSNGYPSDFVSLKFLAFIALYTLAIGFLLEKFTRRRILS